jgi:hypothetical protein
VDTSTIIFVSALACGVLFAGCAVLAQSADKTVPRWKRWALPAGIFAFCTAFGALGYLIDDDTAATTLYEIDAEGPGASAPAAVEFPVGVQHAGAEHELLVAPGPEVSADEPLRLQVRVTDPTGAVLLDEPATLDTRCPDVAVCEWYSYSGRFTPAGTGAHTLVVTVLDPGVELLHVRVGDPLKTDGERAPGY